MKKVLIGVALLCAIAAAALFYRYPGWRYKTVELKVFEDVTASSGISHVGMTYGAAWGDFDGDGLPDLYVSNHLSAPTLYRNLGHGRFEDVTKKWFPSLNPSDDKHGAEWADFNNDGRLDLVQLTGVHRGVGEEPKRLYMNRGDHFDEVAKALGVSNPLSRARMPLWFDFNRDGRLDLFEGADSRFDDLTPPFVFVQQRDGTFAPSDDVAKFDSRVVRFCIITELKGDAPDLLCRISGKGKTAQIFSTEALPMRELDPLPATAFRDVAAGDFDNDGWIDLFLARKNPAPPVSVATVGTTEFIADLWIDSGNVGKHTGFTFRTQGTPTVRVAPVNPSHPISAAQIDIGAAGIHPTGLEFSIAPGDEARGTATFQPGASDGLYVSFAPPDRWQVQLSASLGHAAPGTPRYQEVQLKVVSTSAISTVEAIGNPSEDEAAPFRLFMNKRGKLVEESEKRGVNVRVVPAVDVVAGDFNNDMYLDLFVVVSGDIAKRKNLLLLNRGDGTFDTVADAGGAAGDLVGVGDSVTTADFDNDGRLDLLIATGGSQGRSEGLPSAHGTYHLYRNVLDNGNHWLEISLEGTKSNRDGIGARVDVMAGGVRQVRIEDGGIHARGQNDARLHFGLAKNTRADKITIHWPDGTTQELTDVQANQILHVKEP